MLIIIEFFSTKIGRLVAVGAASIVAFLAFVSHERSVGGRNVVTKIEKANTKAVAIGTGSARKSADGGVRGKIDPTTRNNSAP